MRRPFVLVLVGALLLSSASACRPALQIEHQRPASIPAETTAEPAASSGGADASQPTAQPTHSPLPSPTPGMADEFIKMAKKDLSRRLPVSQEKIKVLLVERVITTGSGAGCRETAELALRDDHIMMVNEDDERYELPRSPKARAAGSSGYRLTLGVGERLYEYVGTGEQVTFCGETAPAH